MPNTPAQFPNFDLPGAEWFGLAPNANISIQGRRRNSLGGSITVAANATQENQASVVLENPFGRGAGIYIHYVSLMFFGAGPTSAGNVQISNANLALNVGTDPLSTVFSLGYAGTTQTSPATQVVSIWQRDILLTRADLEILQGAAVGPALNFNYDIAVKNSSTTASYTVYPYAIIIYTRLDGFTE